MQNKVVDIPDEGGAFPAIETHLSFEPFLKHLRARRQKESFIQREFFATILDAVERAVERYGPPNDQNISCFDAELKLIHAALNPPLVEPEEDFWAIGFPMGQRICFGTDKFYDLLSRYASDEQQAPAELAQYTYASLRQKAKMFYAFIMERVFGFSASYDFEMIHTFVDDAGLQRYHKINIDHSFVDVCVTGELPSFDRLKLRGDFSKNVNFEVLERLIPLDKIRLEGFSVLTIHDVTSEKALDQIKNSIIKGNAGNRSYYEVVQALKTLAGVSGIDFCLLPFLKVNGKVVFDRSKENRSVMFRLWEEGRLTDAMIQDLVEHFQEHPEMLVFNQDEPVEEQDAAFYLQRVMPLEKADYALIPVFHAQEVVGAIELSADRKGILKDEVLARVFRASTLLAQLLKDEAVGMEARMNAVIQEKFTALQSAVQWKFKERAWEYLQKIEAGKPKPIVEDIKFEQVYPLYGVVDVRNSTLERNTASFRDLTVHLRLLERLLLQLKELEAVAVLDEMIAGCRKWLQDLDEALMDSLQIQLYGFLNQKVPDILAYFKGRVRESHALIEAYEEATNRVTGIAYQHRNALERSFQMINKGINSFLDLFDTELQSAYPCYFEKFRSDGVEYDIYIGQSIAPDREFKESYLKNIRLWHLISLATMARITNGLLEQMEKPLYTTQLVFVNANPIDISFRTDERRFDVEGGYNIRYQMIKKRIDKVLIRGTEERLTQPGTVAIVYFTKKEEREYLGYIEQLQKDKMLLEGVERLELQELQGVKGLRALRVRVNFSEID